MSDWTLPIIAKIEAADAKTLDKWVDDGTVRTDMNLPWMVTLCRAAYWFPDLVIKWIGEKKVSEDIACMWDCFLLLLACEGGGLELAKLLYGSYDMHKHESFLYLDKSGKWGGKPKDANDISDMKDMLLMSYKPEN